MTYPELGRYARDRFQSTYERQFAYVMSLVHSAFTTELQVLDQR
jgi:hypothetical protein